MFIIKQIFNALWKNILMFVMFFGLMNAIIRIIIENVENLLAQKLANFECKFPHDSYGRNKTPLWKKLPVLPARLFYYWTKAGGPTSHLARRVPPPHQGGHATIRFLKGFLEGSLTINAFLEGFLESESKVFNKHKLLKMIPRKNVL